MRKATDRISNCMNTFCCSNRQSEEDIPSDRLGFCVLNFLSILSGFLSRGKLTQKWQRSIAEQFSKLRFFINKIDQSINFSQLQVPKRLKLNYGKRIFFFLIHLFARDLVFMISNFFINKSSLANKWMSFSCSNSAL